MQDKEMTNGTADSAGMKTRRRSFLRVLWGIVGLAAVAEFCWVGISVLLSRSKRQSSNAQEKNILAGKIEDFPPATVTAIPQGRFFLSRLEDGGFLALSRTCSHLGCSLNWDAEKGKFICPCHGSSFSLTGEVLTSPAPSPLDYYPVRIENGIVKVDVATPRRRERFEPDQATRIDG